MSPNMIYQFLDGLVAKSADVVPESEKKIYLLLNGTFINAIGPIFIKD